jgi:transcriptional regulator with XRE-family HTH domain
MQEAPELGEWLRGCRDVRGLRLRDIAASTGKTVETISRIERGEVSRPHLTTLVRIVDALRMHKELSDAERDYLVAHTDLARSYKLDEPIGQSSGVTFEWVLKNDPDNLRPWIEKVVDELTFQLGGPGSLEALMTLAQQRGISLRKDD